MPKRPMAARPSTSAANPVTSMGYSRTGPILEEAIGNVLDALLVQGTLGEGSGGLTLRASAV